MYKEHPTLSNRDIKRFILKIEINEPENCWKFIGYLDRDNRGMFTVNKSLYCASRISYLIFNGYFDPSLVIMHTCDNPICVNPNHLISGTQTDNIRDRHNKNRDPKMFGDKNPKAKLTNLDVEKIKSLYKSTNITQETLGKIFGVAEITVNRILNNRSWRANGQL